MLISQPGFKIANFTRVASIFLLIIVINTLIFGKHNDLSFSLAEKRSVPEYKLNENVGSSLITRARYNKKAYISENENTDINLTARFESVDISLIRKYAPILHFHPNEGKQCCFPSSAEMAYNRAKLGKTGKHKVPKSLESETPCYYEALYTKIGFRIKYWFWYNYNDYPTGPDLWGNHPGDWEYLEIYFENNQPYQYHFSNHKGARIKYMSEISTVNSQVKVWVGSGSHANYESPDPANINSILGFTDKVSGGGAIWNTAINLVDVRNTNFCNDHFVGDWGDGKKIYGPISRLSR